MREISKEIKFTFPIGVLYPDIKSFIQFSTHAQIPGWVLNKQPTYKILLQNLQLISYLPSLRPMEPVAFKGSESESQIGVQVAELKRKYNVENGYAVEWILYSGDNVLARDYLYNLKQVKYLNLKTPYLTLDAESVTGYDLQTELKLKIRGQSQLADGVDSIGISGWYTVLISYDELDIDAKFADTNNRITTINNSIATTNQALTSLNNAVTTTNSGLITLWSGLNGNTLKVTALETKINSLIISVGNISTLLENGININPPTPTPTPTPTPNPTPTPTPTPTPEGDDMPYFATKQALIDNNATYATGNTVVLSNADNNAGTNIWVYFDAVSPDNSNFTTDSDRLAFAYKTGAFLNITAPAYSGGFNLFKYVPAWIIDALLGKEVRLYSEYIVNEKNEWITVTVQTSNNTALPPIRTLFIENPTIEYALINPICTVRVTDSFDATEASSIRSYMETWHGFNLLPQEQIRFIFTNISGSVLPSPIQIICIGKSASGYESNYTPYIECAGEADGTLATDLV